ncbi:hypothetical protein GOBAR_DD19258 [Gossypium barbadense]|nr:hypothetical protein GOBAR_DD19258 [Gossypium barbadense]
MVSEASAHLSHQGTDAARGSRIFEPPRCRWCPRLSDDQGPRLLMLSEVPAHPTPRCQWCSRLPHITAPRCRLYPRLSYDQGPSFPMVSEAPTHLRTQFSDGVRGSCTSEHLGADGARGSHMTKGLGYRWCPRLPCRWCPRLSHDKSIMLSLVSEVPTHPSTQVSVVLEAPQDQEPRLLNVFEAPAHHSTEGLGYQQCPRLPHIIAPRCRWCPRLLHDQEPSLLMVSEAPAYPSAQHIQAPRCRWFPRISHDQGPRLPTVYEAPAHPSTKVPVVPEAPARPRDYVARMACQSTTGTIRQSTARWIIVAPPVRWGHRRPGIRWAWAVPWTTPSRPISSPPKELKKLYQCATRRHTYVPNGVQGSRTSKHYDANGARGSRTTKGLGCRWYPRLPPDQGPRERDDLFIVGYVTCNDIQILPLGFGRDSLHHFLYSGRPGQITVEDLTGGGGHRRPVIRWAWAVPWITPGRSTSLPS